MRARRWVLAAACAALLGAGSAPLLNGLLAGNASQDVDASGVAIPSSSLPSVAEAELEAYENYRDLRAWLVGGDRPAGARARFDELLDDRDDRRLLRHAFDQDEPDLAALYELLMRAETNPDVLYGYLGERIPDSLEHARAAPEMRGAILAWRTAYGLEAALEAYEITKQSRFLDLARDAMLAIVSYRDSDLALPDQVRGRVLRAWGTTVGGQYTNIVTQAGRIAAPMARYAWIVANDPSLQATHRRSAELLLEVASDAVAEFDDELRTTSDGSGAYYWRRVDDRIEALNHQASVATALIYLDAVDPDSRWENPTRKLTAFILDMVYEAPNGTLVWQFAPSPEDPRGSRPEPVWKGQITIRFFIHAERLNRIEPALVERISESVERNVLRNGQSPNAQLAPDFQPLVAVDRHGGMNNLVPYLLLGPYEPDLAEAITDLVATRPEIGGWFANEKMASAYLSER